jgi:hypothetical protein
VDKGALTLRRHLDNFLYVGSHKMRIVKCVGSCGVCNKCHLLLNPSRRSIRAGRSTGVSHSRSEGGYHATLFAGLRAEAPCSERTSGPPFIRGMLRVYSPPVRWRIQNPMHPLQGYVTKPHPWRKLCHLLFPVTGFMMT